MRMYVGRRVATGHGQKTGTGRYCRCRNTEHRVKIGEKGTGKTREGGNPAGVDGAGCLV